jgi:CubicO group peptidase (beta-lactamase class C family)
MAYEYSNFGFALLGQVITRVSGRPFQDYITQNILQPLGMKDTVWEFTTVPADKLALGYRWEDNAWKPEPLLHDGTFGAMGGLLTTLDDFARYVAFHLSARPARDESDDGPVRRATLREMQKPSEISGMLVDGQPVPSVNGYGYGLNWNLDSRGVTRVGHSGGLPGFGSHYRFCPDHGIGILSFANLTYAPMNAVNTRVLALLLDKARLPARTLPASPLLEMRQRQIVELLSSWEPELGDAILSDNFFLDRSRESWIKGSHELLAGVGKIVSVGPVAPLNQLRGTFRCKGEAGSLDVFFTLTPETPPRIQQLRLTPVP